MNESKQNDKGKGFPQILHDRSRDAGLRLHILLISLSTGTLGVYFLALTRKTKPPLTLGQQLSALLGLLTMALALGAGLLNLYADCRRYFHWATALQSEERDRRSQHYKGRDRWQRIDRLTARVVGVSFACGIVSSIVYMAFRILRY